MGFQPVVAPLLEVQALAGPPLDLAGVRALAFTGANGVVAFAARSSERALPVFAVGAATAAAARDAGFASVVSADGDVAALALAVARGVSDGAVLHPGPAEPAGDLVGALAAFGVSARAVAVYETVARPPDEATIALIPSFAAVLLHSPRAARVLAAHLVRRPAPDLTALCLSDAVAAPLRAGDLAASRVAAAPTEADLLALVHEIGRRR
jgi:uroporphyrinogen-III synthase